MLDEQQVDLRKVLGLKIGDTMVLNATADSLVELRCGSIALTRGRMGRRNHNIAVRVEAPLSPAAKSNQRGAWSLVAVALNLLLAGLLIAALGFGVVLNRRLMALRDGHGVFVQSVRELDQSVLRAEAGLDQLRKAGEEARDGLHDRILKAREIKAELERLINRAERVRPQPSAAPEPAPAPVLASAPALLRQLPPAPLAAGGGGRTHRRGDPQPRRARADSRDPARDRQDQARNPAGDPAGGAGAAARPRAQDVAPHARARR